MCCLKLVTSGRVCEVSPRTSWGCYCCLQQVLKMRQRSLRLPGFGGRSIEDISVVKIGALMNWSLQTLGLWCCVSWSYLAGCSGVVKKHWQNCRNKIKYTKQRHVDVTTCLIDATCSLLNQTINPCSLQFHSEHVSKEKRNLTWWAWLYCMKLWIVAEKLKISHQSL